MTGNVHRLIFPAVNPSERNKNRIFFAFLGAPM
jgi:hypothetical protein